MMNNISYTLLFVGLIVLAIGLFGFFKRQPQETEQTDNTQSNWVFYLVFFITFTCFMHFLGNLPEPKTAQKERAKTPHLVKSVPHLENTNIPDDAENELHTQTDENQPLANDDKSPSFERPLAFKGYRNLTGNNLDYDLLEPKDITTHFNDLRGYESVKAKLTPFFETIQNYPNNLKSNTIIPHGLMLYGESQADLIKMGLAIGKAWGQKIIIVNGPDFGIDGKGRAQIRELYTDSLILAPLVIIVKEIDYLLPANPTSVEYHESMQRFYKWFDDLYENNQPVLIIGTTSNLYKVDPAAFKLGRFEESVPIEEPNTEERHALLSDLFTEFNIKKGDLKTLTEQTMGFSRADLAYFVNQSKLNANLQQHAVNDKDLNRALQQVRLNKEHYDSYHKVNTANKEFQLLTPNEINTRFSDVAGLQEVKAELNDALDALRNPEKYTQLGATPPRGFLLYGPPGTGKTLMARALAGESQVNFINVSGSEFVEEWVGTGAMRVRNLFNMARRNAPCIIFIDEFDALAVKRSEHSGGGDSERNQTVNQLLVEMDNLDKSRNANVLVMAATNNVSALDKAVLRPGRFDRKIFFRLPNEAERKTLITLLLSTKKIKADFDINKMALDTKGYSPAELNNLINQAVLSAAKSEKSTLTEADINAVQNKVADEMMAIAKQDITLDLDIYRPNQLTANFKSIAGLEDVKKELSQMITFLKNPEKAEKAGINIPKGWIFHGPPGTGKTSLARAVAGESGVTFIATTGSAFVQKWVGTGAERVRELFEVARQYAPAIIFIDEIDAVATKRSGTGNGDGEYAQTTNQLLTELDNVNKDRNAGIIVIGATNRLEMLDEAILRPGRLGKNVYIRLPNLTEREQIFKIYLAKIQATREVDIKKLASTTGGFSGADIENLVSEAAMIAYENNKEKVSMADFENAKDIILLGRETNANVQPDERKNTAYHEAGHALVGIFSKNYPLKFYKITIGVRDETLGVTFFEENIERYGYSKEAFLDIIATKLAGKIAEEMIFGKNYVTSGPSNDLKQATNIAQDMVKKYGMGKAEGEYIAYEYLDSAPSDVVNEQIENIIKEAVARAEKILTDNRDKLDALAKALIEKETLSHDEVMNIIRL